MNQLAGKEWACRQCGTLLGIERGGRMHLKYKTAQFLVTGSIVAVCRRCSEINEIAVGDAEASKRIGGNPVAIADPAGRS